MIGRFRSVSCISVFQGLLLLNFRVGVNLAFTFFSLLTERWQVEKLFLKNLQINPHRRNTDMPSWQCSDCGRPGRHKKGRGRGRKTRKRKGERDPLSSIPLPLPLSPNPLPHLTPATQASLIHNCKANCRARGEWLASRKCHELVEKVSSWRVGTLYQIQSDVHWEKYFYFYFYYYYFLTDKFFMLIFH